MVCGAKAGGAVGTLFGPQGVPIGATIGGVGGGLVVGSAVGFAGYVGGAKGTRGAMETYFPEKLFVQERAYVDDVCSGIEDSIVKLQTI